MSILNTINNFFLLFASTELAHDSEQWQFSENMVMNQHVQYKQEFSWPSKNIYSFQGKLFAAQFFFIKTHNDYQWDPWIDAHCYTNIFNIMPPMMWYKQYVTRFQSHHVSFLQLCKHSTILSNWLVAFIIVQLYTQMSLSKRLNTAVCTHIHIWEDID